ncbi:cell wall hydrolase [Tsuneonella mangrovi]|uniref:cell wall hydrolase n=1 Tax=Tsuneonella mangrovi TaxID=1982042 RepID=UPI000BA1E013|nr:cell wall hydrolase [Tsuneonella mangrovi]
MQFRRATLAAVAAATAVTLFAAGGSGAFAQPGEDQPEVSLPLTAETVPAQSEGPIFVSNPVVQPVDEHASVDAAPSDATSLRELVDDMPTREALTPEMKCLAGAVYFESRGEPLAGQLAVAKVVINRAESDAFPSDYCGVVFQRAQFSFVRGGQMPHIRKSSPAWKRAKAIARIAHEDLWQSKAENALYFHTRSVHPRWSRTRIAEATINSHIFYR